MVPKRSGYPVNLHDTIEILQRFLNRLAGLSLVPDNINIPLLYDDASLVALNKPAGIQMHPAGNMERETVAHFVAQYPELSNVGGNPLRPGIVHRLDRETSGVLVVAKTEPAFQELKQLFQTRAIEKNYVALVYGHMPELQGFIDKPLMQRSGELKRFVVETQAAPVAAREALTLYRVIARYQDFDLLEVHRKPGARIRSAPTSPLSGIRSSATSSMLSNRCDGEKASFSASDAACPQPEIRAVFEKTRFRSSSARGLSHCASEY